MKKEIKDYLHLYLGCDILYLFKTRSDVFEKMYEKRLGKLIGLGQNGVVKTVTVHTKHGNEYLREVDIKLLLRPLSDMTEEEDTQLCAFCLVSDLEHKEKWDSLLMSEAKRTTYLLSKHFDLFGLIEDGLAINAKELESVQK